MHKLIFLIDLYKLSVQFSCSVTSSSLQHRGLRHARPPCPSPTPRVYSNSCSLSRWCHPTISSAVHPLLLPPSVFPSTSVFSNELVLHIRWPKYWSFSFNISPSNEHSGLVSFTMDWLDLLAVQGTLKSLLQHHSSKASILQHSAFFRVQLSHPYTTTGKTITLTAAAAAAAKSLKLCLTIWDPIDGSLTGSSIPGILQARILGWVAIFFSNAWKWKVKMKLLSRIQLFVTPWTTRLLRPWDFPGKSTGVGCQCLLR